MALTGHLGETSRPASTISGERVGLGVRSKTHDEVVEGGMSVGKARHEGVDCYGAARGLGRANAKRLAGSGAKVAVADLDSFGGIADFALPRGFDLDQ